MISIITNIKKEINCIYKEMQKIKALIGGEGDSGYIKYYNNPDETTYLSLQYSTSLQDLVDKITNLVLVDMFTETKEGDVLTVEDSNSNYTRNLEARCLKVFSNTKDYLVKVMVGRTLPPNESNYISDSFVTGGEAFDLEVKITVEEVSQGVFNTTIFGRPHYTQHVFLP